MLRELRGKLNDHAQGDWAWGSPGTLSKWHRYSHLSSVHLHHTFNFLAERVS
jgi:hypothetical protein